MRDGMWAVMAVLAAIAASAPSRAAPVSFSYREAGATIDLTLTIEPDPNTGGLPSNPRNAVDPVGASIIDGVSGTFSDPRLHIANAAITGLEPLNPVAPEPTNLLAPARFSLLKVAHGVPVDGRVSPGLHYDNLYYADGSPQTASDYPPHGGVFDIYGLVFTLGNGDAVNVWSNGVFDGVPKYAFAVTDRIDVLPVPLPGAAPLFGAALLALGAVAFGRRRRATAGAS